MYGKLQDACPYKVRGGLSYTEVFGNVTPGFLLIRARNCFGTTWYGLRHLLALLRQSFITAQKDATQLILRM